MLISIRYFNLAEKTLLKDKKETSVIKEKSGKTLLILLFMWFHSKHSLRPFEERKHCHFVMFSPTLIFSPIFCKVVNLLPILKQLMLYSLTHDNHPVLI